MMRNKLSCQKKRSYRKQLRSERIIVKALRKIPKEDLYQISGVDAQGRPFEMNYLDLKEGRDTIEAAVKRYAEEHHT